MGEDVGRSDAEAALGARRDLGAAYDKELVEAFAERIEQAVEHRVEERLQHRRAPREATTYAEGPTAGDKARQFTLALVSLGVGIPITVAPLVAAENGIPGVIVAWLGIAGVNAAHASSINGPRRRGHDPG